MLSSAKPVSLSQSKDLEYFEFSYDNHNHRFKIQYRQDLLAQDRCGYVVSRASSITKITEKETIEETVYIIELGNREKYNFSDFKLADIIKANEENNNNNNNKQIKKYWFIISDYNYNNSDSQSHSKPITIILPTHFNYFFVAPTPSKNIQFKIRIDDINGKKDVDINPKIYLPKKCQVEKNEMGKEEKRVTTSLANQDGLHDQTSQVVNHKINHKRKNLNVEKAAKDTVEGINIDKNHEHLSIHVSKKHKLDDVVKARAVANVEQLSAENNQLTHHQATSTSHQATSTSHQATSTSHQATSTSHQATSTSSDISRHSLQNQPSPLELYQQKTQLLKLWHLYQKSAIKPEARPHQLKWIQQYVTARGKQAVPYQAHMLIPGPTGSGKSYVYSQIISVMKETALIFVPTDQLRDQSIASIQRFAPHCYASKSTGTKELISALANKPPYHFIVTTYATLQKSYKSKNFTLKNFNIIIGDEAHHLNAPGNYEMFNAIKTDKEVHLYTATPHEKSGNNKHHITIPKSTYALLGYQFDGRDNPIKAISVREAIDQKIVVPVQCVEVALPFRDLEQTEPSSKKNKKDQATLEQTEQLVKKNKKDQATLEQTEQLVKKNKKDQATLEQTEQLVKKNKKDQATLDQPLYNKIVAHLWATQKNGLTGKRFYEAPTLIKCDDVAHVHTH